MTLCIRRQGGICRAPKAGIPPVWCGVWSYYTNLFRAPQPPGIGWLRFVPCLTSCGNQVTIKPII